MIAIAQTSCSSPTDFLKRAVRTAEYYGFIPIEDAPRGMTVRLNPAQRIKPESLSFMRRDERALLPVLNTCAAKGLGRRERPVFLWKQGGKISASGSRYATLELHILGVPSAVAEAVLITVGNAIAEEAGLGKRVVHVNSIGTPESSARYVRELGTYLKKHAEHIAEPIRPRIAVDPLGVFLQIAERGSPLIDRAPQSMEFLNEEERQHLWNVLEYLETTDTYYELNPLVLGSRDCWTHTLFEISRIAEDSGKLVPFARGGRYDTLAGQCAGSNACGAGMSISYEIKGADAPKMTGRSIQRSHPSLYFAHLGLEAKRKSIGVLEVLRRAHIPVHQSLVHEQMGPQMHEANRLAVPYLLIMGYKEVMENAVLVRDTRTNAQATVPIEDLVGYLKRRRVVTV